MTAMNTRTMRAYVLTAPREGEIKEVPVPVAPPGEVIVDVKRVGLCGTDVEFFTGEMPTFTRVTRRTRCDSGMSGLAR